MELRGVVNEGVTHMPGEEGCCVGNPLNVGVCVGNPRNGDDREDWDVSVANVFGIGQEYVRENASAFDSIAGVVVVEIDTRFLGIGDPGAG